MTNLLIVILDDLACMPDILRAWRDIGVPGVTILESAGAYRVSSWLHRVGLGGLDRLFEAGEVSRRTLLAAIESDDLLAQAVAEAERVVNGFERPNSGLLLVLPVSQAKGLQKVEPKPRQEVLPSALRPKWALIRDISVAELAAVLNLEPTIVSRETPLDDVARAMLAHPNVHVACVVAEEGRLVGLLNLSTLANDIFFHILPEGFLSEISDLGEVMEFADRSRIHTAADAMQKAAWVKQGETVREAFKRMHELGLPGLPIVDAQYHVVGYINLLELLAICLKQGEEVSGEEETR